VGQNTPTDRTNPNTRKRKKGSFALFQNKKVKKKVRDDQMTLLFPKKRKNILLPSRFFLSSFPLFTYALEKL